VRKPLPYEDFVKGRGQVSCPHAGLGWQAILSVHWPDSRYFDFRQSPETNQPQQRHRARNGFVTNGKEQKRVVVVGAGWAGLGSAYHLAQQGYDVTLLEAGNHPGGLVAGWQTAGGKSVEAGIHGFWYPYNNIFSLIDELGIQPFTPFTRSAQYSPAGLEVESPLFQDMPPLPSP
jgi:hypothetical protein